MCSCLCVQEELVGNESNLAVCSITLVLCAGNCFEKSDS